MRALATVFGAALFGLAAFAPAAAAQPRRADEPAPHPCGPEPGDRLHDGFFARSAPGIAFLAESVSDRGALPERSAVRGVGQSGALSFGGTPARGLVVGGVVWTARIDPTFVEGGATVTPDDDSVKVTFLRVGPFIDWYPRPERGFHVQGSLGLAVSMESDTKGNPIEPNAYGFSPALGLGQEWFVASELSLGFLWQVGAGYLERRTPGGPEKALFVVPELSLSATFH